MSSVLDANATALGGREAIQAEPKRRGADCVEVVLDLSAGLLRRQGRVIELQQQE